MNIAEVKLMKIRLGYGAFIAVFIIGLTACGSTSTHKITHSAQDPEWSGEPFARILVVGLEERKYRIPFEDTFVEELRSRGVDALASHRSVPHPSRLSDPAEVEKIMESTGVDGVITVRAEGFREANNQAWGAAYAVTWFLIDDYQTRRDVRRVVAAGAAVDNMDAAQYGVESELWSAASYRSVWVGKTDTYDAGDLKGVVSTYADVVVDELKDNGLIRWSF